MRRFILRCCVALLTFSIGIISSGTWSVQRQSSIKPFENIAPLQPNATDLSGVETPGRDCIPAFEGRYSNLDYAFSVQMPKGMTGFGSCATNHGFGIDLTHPTTNRWLDHASDDTSVQSYLYVDASFNGLEWQSLDEAMRARLEYLKDDGATDIALVIRTSTHLSKLTAIRFVARYNKSGEAMMEDVVLAFRKDLDIVYTLSLTAPVSRFNDYKGIVTRMQQDWRLQPLT